MELRGDLCSSSSVVHSAINCGSGNWVEDTETASGFLTGWVGAEVRQTGDLVGDPPAAVTQQFPPWRRREGTCRFSGTDVNGRVASRRRESLYTEKISVGGLKAAPCTSADKDLDSRDFR